MNQQPANTKNMKIGCAVVGIPVIVIIMIFSFTQCSNNNSSTNAGTTDPKITAWVAATHAVQEDLKSPSTANFPWYDTNFITDNGNGTYLVSSYVDAENSFGTKIRNNWSCTVDSNENISNIVIDN